MQKTLEGWEKYLRSYLGHIKLLAEIPLDESDILSIQGFIRDLVTKDEINKASKCLFKDYPMAFVTYLSAFSAINTQYAYWDEVAINIGTYRQLHNLKWHTQYLRILDKLGLGTIELTGPRKYINTIRIHGGIPAYSLPDYFEYLLIPSVEKKGWRDIPPDELIQQLISDEIKFYGDRTILNFFEFSGEIGIKYLRASQQMVKDFKEQGVFTPDSDSILPSYVVDVYEDFLEHSEGKRIGIPTPKIVFDLYTKSMVLALPKFVLTPNIAGEDLYWMITDLENEFHFRIPIETRRQGSEIISIEKRYDIQKPTNEYMVAVVIAGENDEVEVHKKWKIPLFPESANPPILAWQNIEKEPTLLRWRQKLPAESLLILIPENCTIMVDGQEECIREFENLSGSFSGWKVGGWDFSGANYIRVERNNEFPWQPIPIKAKIPEAKFINGEVFDHDESPDGSPLFIGKIPSLRFPFPIKQKDLQKWRVVIRTVGIGSPDISTLFSLDEKNSDLTQNEKYLDLNLNNIFGENRTVGTYEIKISGPLGFSQEIGFRIWPNVSIFDMPNEIVNHTDKKISFTVASTMEFRCEVQAGREDIFIEQSTGLFKVTAPSSIEQVDCYLTTKLENGLTVRVPLYIAIPGAKWLVGGIEQNDKHRFGWSSQAISLPIDMILQSTYPCLFLRIHGLEVDCEESRMILVDPLNLEKEIQVIQSQRGLVGNQTLYFDLSAIKNTLLELSYISIFQLVVNVKCKSKKEPAPLTVITLRKSLRVSDVHLKIGDDLSHCLTWKEPYPLKNRRVQIWSVWQPWADPIEIKIPDGEPGISYFSGVSLPKKDFFRACFYTALPWEKERTAISDDNYINLMLIEPNDKIKEIEEELQDPENSEFKLHFTLACIYNTEEIIEKREKEIRWCLSNIETASISKVIAFHDWVGRFDKSTQKAIAIKMRKAQIVEHVFNRLDENNLLRKKYIEILANIKMDFKDPETAWLFIDFSNNPKLEIRSFYLLVNHGDEMIVERILIWVDEGRMSIDNAVDIMAKNPIFSVKQLEKTKQRNSLSEVLISKIVDVCEDVIGYIKVGFRAFTEYGNGLIRKIYDSNKSSIPYIRVTDSRGYLNVDLHDKIDSETVEIDLENLEIHFLDAKQLFMCTKCHEFVSKSQEKVMNHNRIDHDGLGPKFRIIKDNILSIDDEIKYMAPDSNLE